MDRPEFALIDWIRKRVIDRPPVKLGIGDDAAVIGLTAGSDLLVTTDMLMEGTDFTFPPASPRQVGRKALAVNLSDIAAMGGRPTVAFVSIALPIDRGSQFAREVHQGMLDLADKYGVVLAGGDTNSWHGPLVINIALLGQPNGSRAITRAGAKPGDWLFVTGEFGGSIVEHHLMFEPRVREAGRLTQLVDVHAMLDVSDGLAADIHHMLDQSHVGAVIDPNTIPIRQTAKAMQDGRSPLEHALSDGEDFELVFTVSPTDGQRLLTEWDDPTPLKCIGQITESAGCWLKGSDDQLTPLAPLGWNHPLAD